MAGGFSAYYSKIPTMRCQDCGMECEANQRPAYQRDDDYDYEPASSNLDDDIYGNYDRYSKDDYRFQHTSSPQVLDNLMSSMNDLSTRDKYPGRDSPRPRANTPRGDRGEPIQRMNSAKSNASRDDAGRPPPPPPKDESYDSWEDARQPLPKSRENLRQGSSSRENIRNGSRDDAMYPNSAASGRAAFERVQELNQSRHSPRLDRQDSHKKPSPSSPPNSGFRQQETDRGFDSRSPVSPQTRDPFQYQDALYQEPHDAYASPVCLECKQPIRDPNDGFEIEILGGWFHANCFYCTVCTKTFDDDNPFVPHEGKSYCELHYEQLFLSTCAACNKPITDGKISHAFGRVFHARHLRCHICKHRIRGPHVEHNGKAFCQTDYEKLTTSACYMCKGPIQDESVHACGQVWHKRCFGCMTCQRPFPDKKFYVHDNAPYCLEHYYDAANTVCGGCSTPIQGACVDVQEMGLRFHQDCWRCRTCDVKLTDIYYSYQDQAYCEHDIDEAFHHGGGAKPARRHTLLRGGKGW
ncbi:hypothetical protein HDV03_003666 [Kappamyces sp. JEL0829]|nr:hypothetical protein HDV03_003666 [Kappamyces sp. JEL0829]